MIAFNGVVGSPLSRDGSRPQDDVAQGVMNRKVGLIGWLLGELRTGRRENRVRGERLGKQSTGGAFLVDEQAGGQVDRLDGASGATKRVSPGVVKHSTGQRCVVIVQDRGPGCGLSSLAANVDEEGVHEKIAF